jgi:hypothetical protein
MDLDRVESRMRILWLEAKKVAAMQVIGETSHIGFEALA